MQRQQQQQVQRAQKTVILQVSADNLDDASSKMQNASSGSNQCIIAMVKRSYGCCCFDIKFDVPAGFIVMEESCGKSTGIMQAGANWCYCANKRVACMLTKNMVQYDAPVQKCPTKDNAYVDIDIHFTFRLPQELKKVMQFVYELGAARFDELLASEVEENIRDFIQGVWLVDIFDLKSDMATTMMNNLNKKFSDYGIVFEQCNVTNVIVNPQLQYALQEKTKIKFDLKNHIKEQENKKLMLENTESQKLTDLQRTNDRKMYELSQEIQRATTDKKQDEIQAQTKKASAIIDAERNASVLITKAKGQQLIVVNQVKALTVTLTNEAAAAAQKLTIQTEQQVAVMGINTKTDNTKAKAKYQALQQECEAENANLQAINAQREHNYQISKAAAYESLCSGNNTQIVMSGSSGENMIQKIFDLGDN